MEPDSFAARLLAWFDAHGRHDLPWQQPRDAYRVWLAEIMLQQTQVTTVVPYFQRFVGRFADLDALARAPLDDVLALWSGLGYYARARNLHRCAQVVVAEHGGDFPRDLESITALPGIGRSTGGAILAQAFGARHAILDGNVRRVLARHDGIAGWPGAPPVQRALWSASEKHLPQARLPDYTQAIMDLGATLCTARKPQCARCPVSVDCAALQLDRIAELPGRKPRRERPHRRAQLLLIENGSGEILLERRPPTGIWGGLWSLPMRDDAQASLPELRIAEHRMLESLPQVEHGFTHFTLTLHPVHLRATRLADDVAEAPHLNWTTIAAALRLGLPAPIRRLLANLTLQCPAPFTASS
jgi:A/G-specific adenine glycosylase